ncbi:alpha/beta hydrolase [Terrarubrum flagellatum]|uniref:alpha/beta fold hydrolase n=1 Tax=Terrirubrum flagellatum TaxID=2895980 RepID=UPI0031452414
MKEALPLVLIPGLLADETTWKRQIEHFSRRHLVITPRDHFAKASIAVMADCILARLPPRFALVGWSMGGYISFEIMRKAASRVARLGLISTSARADAPGAAAERRESVALAERESPSVAWRQKMGLSFYRPDRLSAETLAEMEEMNDRLGVDLYRTQQEAIISRADSRPLLGGIRCPTLVICGTHDQRTPPACSWEIASAVKGAELHLLAECGHCSPIEDPASVNSLLGAWLERSID